MPPFKVQYWPILNPWKYIHEKIIWAVKIYGIKRNIYCDFCRVSHGACRRRDIRCEIVNLKNEIFILTNSYSPMIGLYSY